MEQGNDFELQWKYQKPNFILGEPLAVSLRTSNKNPNVSVFLGDYYLHFGGDSFFKPASKRLPNEYDVADANVQLQVRENVSVDRMQEKLLFELKKDDSTIARTEINLSAGKSFCWCQNV